MVILAADTCGTTVTAALVRDGRVVAETYLDAGLTHGETLLPAIAGLFALTKIEKPDLIAVTKGPGSFTGLRSGAATALGLAFAWGIPCAGVSSLEAAARGLKRGGVICARRDARRGRAYRAFFRADGEVFSRLTPDAAVTYAELEREIAEYGEVLYAELPTGAGIALSEREIPFRANYLRDFRDK